LGLGLGTGAGVGGRKHHASEVQHMCTLVTAVTC